MTNSIRNKLLAGVAAVAVDVVAVKGMMTRMRIERQDVTTGCAPFEN
jgi:hypothetical protein